MIGQTTTKNKLKTIFNTIVIQINGKKRSLINASLDLSENELMKMVNEDPQLIKYLQNKEIKKKIYIKNKPLKYNYLKIMKNLIIITVLFFVTACGYTSVYKNKTTDLQINIMEMKGDNEFNNFIKNEINLYSNDSSKNKFEISILSNYNKKTISKDASGVATNFKVH